MAVMTIEQHAEHEKLIAAVKDTAATIMEIQTLNKRRKLPPNLVECLALATEEECANWKAAVTALIWFERKMVKEGYATRGQYHLFTPNDH